MDTKGRQIDQQFVAIPTGQPWGDVGSGFATTFLEEVSGGITYTDVSMGILFPNLPPFIPRTVQFPTSGMQFITPTVVGFGAGSTAQFSSADFELDVDAQDGELGEQPGLPWGATLETSNLYLTELQRSAINRKFRLTTLQQAGPV